jgi:predicted nuclease of predicted toxin-antitoxin system
VKLLVDQNISYRLVKSIEQSFPGTQQVRRLGLENGSDKVIWEYAKAEEFTIVTFDSDFYDLSVL